MSMAEGGGGGGEGGGKRFSKHQVKLKVSVVFKDSPK